LAGKHLKEEAVDKTLTLSEALGSVPLFAIGLPLTARLQTGKKPHMFPKLAKQDESSEPSLGVYVCPERGVARKDGTRKKADRISTDIPKSPRFGLWPLTFGIRGAIKVDIARQKWYLENMNRKHTAIYRMSDRPNDDFVSGTPADRLSLVWPLTREIASLSKKHDVERRLQRHVTRLIRREG
jgi:hypothetical protein